MGVVVARHRLQQWPGPSNTGVPAGTSLTPSGDVTTSSNGQVVQDLDVAGAIFVNHDNVTIRRCRVTAEPDAVGGCIIPNAPHTGIVMEDCELDGSEVQGLCGVFDASGFTLRRLNIHGTENGLDVNGNIDVRDCWIHDLGATGPDPHSDGAQFNVSAANIVMVHNFIDASTPVQGTSAIITYQPAGGVNTNVKITGNKLWGGAAVVYLPTETASNFYFNYNRLDYEAFFLIEGSPANITEYVGNVRDSTGQAI